MTVPVAPWLLERVSIGVEHHPDVSRTGLTKLVRGAKQPILWAIDNLLEQRFIEQHYPIGSPIPVLRSLKPYRQPQPPPAEEPPETEKPPERPTLSVVREQKTGSPKPAKTDGRKNGTNGNGSSANRQLPVVEHRCRCCRDAPTGQKINQMLVEGWSLRVILESLAETNADRPANQRITIDSLETHREKHFPRQAARSAKWLRLIEERRAQEISILDQATTNHLTVKAALEVVLIKGYSLLLEEDTQVSVQEMIVAARELHRLTAQEDSEGRWAHIVATQNRIIAAFRNLPSQFQQQILDEVDEHKPLVIEGTVVTPDPFTLDPFDDDKDVDDDED